MRVEGGLLQVESIAECLAFYNNFDLPYMVFCLENQFLFFSRVAA